MSRSTSAPSGRASRPAIPGLLPKYATIAIMPMPMPMPMPIQPIS
jgi:hypothetical protein